MKRTRTHSGTIMVDEIRFDVFEIRLIGGAFRVSAQAHGLHLKAGDTLRNAVLMGEDGMIITTSLECEVSVPKSVEASDWVRYDFDVYMTDRTSEWLGAT